MSALADNPASTVWDTVPTTAIYRVPVVDETPVEPLPGLDATALVGGSGAIVGDLTEITLRRELSTGIVTAHVAALGALLGASIGLIGPPVIFESTPFTIKTARAAVVTVDPAGPGVGDTTAVEPAAYRAFKDLGRWLDAEDGQVADMVGIGRTTPYTWKREGREPRAATAQRIYEYHATLDSLHRRLGAEGLRRWLHEAVPARRESLLSGNLSSLEGDVHRVLFRRPATRLIDLSAAPEDTSEEAVVPGADPIRSSGRRPRRPGA